MKKKEMGGNRKKNREVIELRYNSVLNNNGDTEIFEVKNKWSASTRKKAKGKHKEITQVIHEKEEMWKYICMNGDGQEKKKKKKESEEEREREIALRDGWKSPKQM